MRYYRIGMKMVRKEEYGYENTRGKTVVAV